MHLLDHLFVTSHDIFFLSDVKKRYQYEHELHRRQQRNVYKRSSFRIFKTSFTLWHRRKNTMYRYIVGNYKINLHSLQKRSENITLSSLFWLFIKLIHILIRLRFLVSNVTSKIIQLYRGGQIYWWRTLEYREKTATFRMSLTNFII